MLGGVAYFWKTVSFSRGFEGAEFFFAQCSSCSMDIWWWCFCWSLSGEWKVVGESVETIHTGTEQAFLATHLESWRSDSMLIVCERQQNLLASRKLDGDQFFIFTGLCSCDASLLGIPFKQVFFSKGVWCRSFLRLFVRGSCEAITGLGTESDHGMCKNGRPALLLILWPALTKLMKNDSRSVLCPILLSVQWPAMARLTKNGPREGPAALLCCCHCALCAGWSSQRHRQPAAGHHSCWCWQPGSECAWT